MSLRRAKEIRNTWVRHLAMSGLLGAWVCVVVPVAAQDGQPPVGAEAASSTGIGLFESMLRQTEQQMRTLDGRMPKMRNEAQDLINQVSALTKPFVPSEDPEEDSGPTSVRKVPFRPPLEEQTSKPKQPVMLIFHNQRVGVANLASLAKPINAHILKIRLGQAGPGTMMMHAASGDYDAQFKAEKVSSTSFSVQIALTLKSGRTGETFGEAIQPDSALMKMLQGLDLPNSLIQCVIYPDSFEAFQETRKELWKKQETQRGAQGKTFELGWSFKEPGTPVYIGAGTGSRS